jgi:hypothetical protein
MSYNLTGAAYGGNICLSKAALAAGTTTTYTVANATTYAIKGQLYSMAPATSAATPLVDANTGMAFKPLTTNQACVFAFLVSAAGGVSVAQGPIVSNLDLTGGAAACQFPGYSDDRTPFAYLLAQAGPTAVGNWTLGVSNLSSVTGMTFAFRDVMDAPAQPITS